MRRWTAEEEAWLREKFATEHIGARRDGFERECGRRPTQRAMWQKCFKLGLRKRPREVPARAVRPIRWSCEPEMLSLIHILPRRFSNHICKDGEKPW